MGLAQVKCRAAAQQNDITSIKLLGHPACLRASLRTHVRTRKYTHTQICMHTFAHALSAGTRPPNLTQIKDITVEYRDPVPSYAFKSHTT